MDPHLSSLKELCRDLGAESGLAGVGSPTWGLCAQWPPPHTPKPLDLGDMLTFLAQAECTLELSGMVPPRAVQASPAVATVGGVQPQPVAWRRQGRGSS